MANPRTPITELRLQASPNLGRALKREQADAEKTLTPEAQSEVARIDHLIQKAMDACERGQTVHGKRNPAFAHIALLVKTRKAILETKRAPEKQDTQDMLDEIDAQLAKWSEVNVKGQIA